MNAGSPPVTVVSGLPRSGTSLMMQILKAGGLPLLTDQGRAADADNPRGYFEYEPVKATRQDPSWVAAAVGKAVKVVHLLLYDLPADFAYRVLFMRRDLEEVLASQRAMLRRQGKEGARLSDDQLAAAFQKQLRQLEEWLSFQPHFTVLFVGHRDLLQDPSRTLAEVRTFLGEPLDVAAMERAIDPTLYRQRGGGVR
jgi:hypothetical protein